MTLNANTRRIVQLLEQNPEMRHSEIAREVGVDRRRVYQVQKYLTKNGAYLDFDPRKLIRARCELEWSVRQLARAANVNASQVSRWERGEAAPRALERERVAKALGITSSQLGKSI